MTTLPKLPPSRWYYLVAAIPMVIGGLVMTIGLLSTASKIDAMPGVNVPGSGEVKLGTGELVVYGQFDGASEDTRFELRCELIEVATGEPVELETRSSKVSYNVMGKAGRSLWNVTIARAGTYRVTCEGDSMRIAFGPGIGGAMAIMIVAMFAGVIGSIVWWVMVYKRRKRGLAAIAAGPAIPPASAR